MAFSMAASAGALAAGAEACVGRWAAGLLGRDADAYAQEVVEADFQEAGEEDVFRKLRADFDAAGVSISDEDIRQKMFAYLQDAVAEVKQ